MKPMATRRKDGRWVTSKMVKGERTWGYGDTPEEAEADLRAKLQPIPSMSLSCERGTLHDLAKRFWYPTLEHHQPLTKRRYEDAYVLHVFPTFGGMDLTEIDRGTVQEWMNALAKTHSASSCSIAALVLGQILRIALDEDLIAKDPMRGLKRPPSADKRERAMPVQDAVALLQKVKGESLSCPVFLASVLGLRRGEIAGLKWEDLDRIAGTLRIRRQRQDFKDKIGITERRPKTGTRTLYLTPGIIAEIDDRGDLDSPYICTRNGKPWRPDAMTRLFDWHKGKWGLPEEWTLHDLRHLAGGLLNAAGVQLTGIAAVLGHTTTKMSERYVTHSEELRKADAERLSRMILG